ncbi:MAG: L-ribulose-5-phosphate 4-epimerase AraD [Lentisphaerae bacterium]|nr:L-ribulose-5-phosphate 4-epimerase AraD [Lentisphaerota bacterium]
MEANLVHLRESVYEANMMLKRSGLTVLTWGNVSGMDRDSGLIGIKPSGIPYEQMRPEDIVLVDLDCRVKHGLLRPSSDTPIHAALYRQFGAIGGIAHTHSRYATSFAQACLEIPCLGTTHADVFQGPVPVTRALRAAEVQADYEQATGTAIVERMSMLDPSTCPGILVRQHGPFTWGPSSGAAVANSIALEEIAAMAATALALKADTPLLSQHVAAKHFSRRHGSTAYYGQPGRQ